MLLQDVIYSVPISHSYVCETKHFCKCESYQVDYKENEEHIQQSIVKSWSDFPSPIRAFW